MADSCVWVYQILHDRPLQSSGLAGRHALAPGGAGPRGERVVTVHTFVDHSNAWIGAAATMGLPRGRSLPDPAGFVHALVRQTTAGQRALGARHAAGTQRGAQDATWPAYRACGFMVHLQKTGGGEDLVDDALHAQILAELLRHDAVAEGWAGEAAAPHKLVLVTGDGNDNKGAVSFPECCTRALQMKWQVEVWGWRRGMSAKFNQLAAGHPGQMTVRYLDELALVPAGVSRPGPAPFGRGRGAPAPWIQPAGAGMAWGGRGRGAL